MTELEQVKADRDSGAAQAAEIIALANLLKSNIGESTKPEVLRQVAETVAEKLIELAGGNNDD